MQISSLSLTNFRNFSSKKIVFDPKLTVIIGPNGSGKSNILEAIGLLSAVRLRRVETDLDLVKFGKSETKLEAKVEGSALPNVSVNEQNGGERVKLTMNFQVIDETYIKKSYFIDEIRKRWVDFTNHLAIVEFAPSDLELISGSPSVRRHHLDSLLSSLDRDYWRAITNYNKVIVRRNKVLQRIMDGKSKKGELDFWDDRLLDHGKYLTEARQKFFEFVNFVESTSVHPRGDAKVSLGLHPGGVIPDGYRWQLKESTLSQEKLSKNRERDIAAGVTLSGPHRDDFVFVFRGKNLEFFGSRGEQRMAILALKLVELEYFASKRGSRPVLGLDDIFSELDWEHREAVLGVIEKQQTIITAAEAESLPKEIFKKAEIIELE